MDFVPERVDRSSPIGRGTVDGAGPRTVPVCGAYAIDVDRPHPLFGDLPEGTADGSDNRP